MDLNGWLRSTPRPLVVSAPGGRAVRLAVERLARERGWELAASPADADLLVVCGTPDAALAEAVERVWSQLPSPRARANIGFAELVGQELDRARAHLVDRVRQRDDAAGRAATVPTGDATESGPDAHAAHDDAPDHDQHGTAGDHVTAMDEHGPQSHGDRHAPADHDMHMMHGGEVAGLPMADRAPDRDGLTLDVLHVTLGPILADWPAGLVVAVTLQGDVVQSAQVEVIGDAWSSWDGPPAAAALDSLTRLLAVCGSSTAARTARRLRDDVLAGVADDAEVTRFARRLRRSRTLRWATDGLGWLEDRHGVLGGDATQRWHRWVATVEGAGPAAHGSPADRARVALAELPRLLEGQELAAARVVVASLDPDLDALVAARAAQ